MLVDVPSVILSAGLVLVGFFLNAGLQMLSARRTAGRERHRILTAIAVGTERNAQMSRIVLEAMSDGRFQWNSVS